MCHPKARKYPDPRPAKGMAFWVRVKIFQKKRCDFGGDS
jgi:hypothetical protein